MRELKHPRTRGVAAPAPSSLTETTKGSLPTTRSSNSSHKRGFPLYSVCCGSGTTRVSQACIRNTRTSFAHRRGGTLDVDLGAENLGF